MFVLSVERAWLLVQCVTTVNVLLVQCLATLNVLLVQCLAISNVLLLTKYFDFTK
jgi:hypothetical protein